MSESSDSPGADTETVGTGRDAHDSNEATAHVVAVVLNWNAREETLTCLESLVASDWPRLTAIVVDNASTEPIGSDIEWRFPGTVVLRTKTNLGFAGGMNAGMHRALALGADYVLLLNNDTVVDKAMVRKLVDAATARPDLGIVVPLELFLSEPDTVRSAGLRFELSRAYHGPPRHMGERDRGQFGGVAEVGAAQGTAMLVPASAVREVGMLDEDLYLYGEDVEWSVRMRQAGRRIYVAYDARLWHAVATGSGGDERSPVVTYYMTRNCFEIFRRHTPARSARRYVRYLEIAVINLVHAIRSPRPLANACAVVDGWRDFRLRRLGRRAGA